jgi:hypothetical protein
MSLKLTGPVYVKKSPFEDCPDAYLCIDTEEQQAAILSLSSKDEVSGLQILADALNEWAGKTVKP